MVCLILAHVAGWEPYGLHDTGYVSWVGPELCRSCTTFHTRQVEIGMIKIVSCQTCAGFTLREAYMNNISSSFRRCGALVLYLKISQILRGKQYFGDNTSYDLQQSGQRTILPNET